MKNFYARFVLLLIGPAIRLEIEKREAMRAAVIHKFSSEARKAVDDAIRKELKPGGLLRS